MAKRSAEQTFTLEQVRSIVDASIAEAVAKVTGAAIAPVTSAPIMGMLATRPEAPAKVAPPAGDPNKLVFVGVSAPKPGKKYALATYSYGGENWTAVRYNQGEQQWPTRVGSPVLVGPDGQPFIVNSGEDRFEVLRFLACRAASNMGERITVSAKDLPAALAILAPNGKPTATLTIMRSGLNGK